MARSEKLYRMDPRWEPGSDGLGIVGEITETEARARCEAGGVSWDAFLRLYSAVGAVEAFTTSAESAPTATSEN